MIGQGDGLVFLGDRTTEVRTIHSGT